MQNSNSRQPKPPTSPIQPFNHYLDPQQTPPSHYPTVRSHPPQTNPVRSYPSAATQAVPANQHFDTTDPTTLGNNYVHHIPVHNAYNNDNSPLNRQKLSVAQVIYIIGGWALAALAFFGDFSGHQSGVIATSFKRDLCHTIIQPNTVLSRETLAKLLAVPERSPKTQIRDVVAQPYCQLPELEVRAGATAQREAYPLAFDPKTWLVVLYEGDEYAGYAFRFAQ